MTVSETRTECPRCGSTSPSRALGGCFHLWHADPELRAEPSRGAADARTSKDYAIEFGGYLADAVEHYLQVRNLFDGKQATIGCDVADQDLLNDHRRALENGVGEFRKRAARVEPESGHVVLLEALRKFGKCRECGGGGLKWLEPESNSRSIIASRNKHKCSKCNGSGLEPEAEAAIQQAERT